MPDHVILYNLDTVHRGLKTEINKYILALNLTYNKDQLVSQTFVGQRFYHLTLKTHE